MAAELVTFLDTRRIIDGNRDGHIADGWQVAPVSPAESDGKHVGIGGGL